MEIVTNVCRSCKKENFLDREYVAPLKLCVKCLTRKQEEQSERTQKMQDHIAQMEEHVKELERKQEETIKSPGHTPSRTHPSQNLTVPAGYVLIEGARFIQGSPASELARSKDEVQYRVKVSSFYMKAMTVTQGEWKTVMGDSPSNFKGDDRPVEQISWYDAVAYCNALSSDEGLESVYQVSGESVMAKWDATGYRLPTETEWEYACRGGEMTIFHYGNSLDSTQANFDGTYPYGEASNGVHRGETMAVGSFSPNAFGLYDMHGNVWEWCWDWYGDYPTGIQTGILNDPRGPSNGSDRVRRGGSWLSSGKNLRSARRSNYSPSYRYYHLGFRPVRKT